MTNCNCCGGSIPDELIPKITQNKEPVFCSLCGVRLIQNDLEIEENSIPEHAMKFPNGRVFYDKDFPKPFRDDLILIISRLSYLQFRASENSNSKEVIDETLLDVTSKYVLASITEKIQNNLLINLDGLSLDEFNKHHSEFIQKINNNPKYYKDLEIYARWLIYETYSIIHNYWDATKGLEKFERVIRDDVKSFASTLENLTQNSTETDTNNEDNEDKNEELDIESNELADENPPLLTKAEIKNAQPSELFEQFLYYSHKVESINQIITEFNKSRNWIKNFKPTKTFLTHLTEKKKQLENEDQLKMISTYIILIEKIMKKDAIAKAIREKIVNNKGDYNAYDIQEWLLISDTAARNFLKKMFPNEDYEEYIRTQTYVSLDTVKEIARKKGGKCLSKTIKNAKSKVDLECAEGHKFTTTYNSLVYKGTWCPDCHIYVGEAICRQFFEHIFRRPFPKSYPPWLVNRNGNQMELDMYNKIFAVAGEYQGIQHRKRAFGLTDEDVKKIQEEDAYRLKKCEHYGVVLLQIPDEEIVPYDKMQDFIVHEYEKKTRKTLGNIPKYDYRDFAIHENEYAKKFREYVEEKGGTLLTPYFSARKEVTLLCEQGHEWITTPDSVYRDNWCSECAGNKKGTTDDFQEIVKQFNCEMLEEYINAKTSLQLRCQKGHEFKKDPYWLKKNYESIEILCPECQMDIYAHKFEDFVKKKGGSILSPYKGRFKPIKIKCKNKHEWNTTPAIVYQGSWCKTCADENNPNKERREFAKQEIIEMLKSIKYNLLSEYQNNTKQVKIRCQRRHSFTMTPKYLKRLIIQDIEPCPKCRK